MRGKRKSQVPHWACGLGRAAGSSLLESFKRVYYVQRLDVVWRLGSKGARVRDSSGEVTDRSVAVEAEVARLE